jgi:hypothetical protein
VSGGGGVEREGGGGVALYVFLICGPMWNFPRKISFCMNLLKPWAKRGVCDGEDY